MSEIGSRRWFQFDIPDVMIAVAVAAITTSLSQPIESTESRAGDTAPFFGKWSDDNDLWHIEVRPDGSHSVHGPEFAMLGSHFGCLERAVSASNEFVLRYGDERVTLQAPRGGITPLNAWGRLLTKKEFWAGSYQDGLPHGKWIRYDSQGQILEDVEYRYGTRKEAICFGSEDESPDVESAGVGDSSGEDE